MIREANINDLDEILQLFPVSSRDKCSRRFGAAKKYMEQYYK